MVKGLGFGVLEEGFLGIGVSGGLSVGSLLAGQQTRVVQER